VTKSNCRTIDQFLILIPLVLFILKRQQCSHSWMFQQCSTMLDLNYSDYSNRFHIDCEADERERMFLRCYTCDRFKHFICILDGGAR
jgi:hypothetical protein